jgi:hypothetical protein
VRVTSIPLKMSPPAPIDRLTEIVAPIRFPRISTYHASRTKSNPKKGENNRVSRSSGKYLPSPSSLDIHRSGICKALRRDNAIKNNFLGGRGVNYCRVRRVLLWPSNSRPLRGIWAGQQRDNTSRLGAA